jgi:drug/metabolite transporter (DMT)-like permease
LTLAVAGLLTLIWGTTWAAIRIGLSGIPPLTGVALRFAIACLVLFGFGLLQRVSFGRSPRERLLWIINTLLSFCASYVIIYWCEQWVPSGLASVLWATFPLFLACMAHFFLPGERLRLQGILGALIGFGGVAVIFSEDFSLLGGRQVAVASGVLLLSPLAAAVSNIFIKRWGKDVHPVSLAAVPMGLTAGLVGALALVVERGRPLSWTGATVGSLLYLAIVGSAVTFGLYYWLLSHHSATKLSMIAYGTPVIAVLFGAVFMQEPVTPRTLVGSAMVVSGVALAVGLKHRGDQLTSRQSPSSS